MHLLLTGTSLAEDISRLQEKAAKEGQVRVIVSLRLPTPGFKPEGTLGSPETVKRQRESIVSTREKLLVSLAKNKVLVYAVYDSVPYVAMKVDAASLQQLANSPYVMTIHEDFESEPHKSNADVESGENTAGDMKSIGSD